MLCNPNDAMTVITATMAEWIFGGPFEQDQYDVCLVNGFNLPMRIDNNIACPITDWPVDLGEYFHWLGYIIVSLVYTIPYHMIVIMAKVKPNSPENLNSHSPV